MTPNNDRNHNPGIPFVDNFLTWIHLTACNYRD